MRSAVKWMAHNHVAANLLMLTFIVGGLIIGYTVKQEVFPEVLLDRISISVAYPGASPEEVEEGIILKIEENISGVDGIKEITATAAEGLGTVTAVIQTGENADLVLQDIKSEVDRITTFPKEAEEPVITKVLNRREVISIVVYGNVSERVLREQAESIRDEILEMDNITQIELGGVRPYEISIEISEDTLRRYDLTLNKVAEEVRKASIDLPGGTIKAEGGEIMVRTKERRYTGREYSGITIGAAPDGTELKLGDIALVKDGFEDTDQFARFDGMPAAMIRVFRVGDQKPTEISDTVRSYVEGKKERLAGSLNIATWNDTSELLESRMKLLIKNACLGLILVFIVLSLFLQIRLALWVMLGIPISMLGTLLIMPAIDVSINMVSLFAFIMAIGIVVDDAVVIGENVFEHRQQGKPFLQAAVDGAQEVGIPVIFSILTSVAAFVPLIFVEGMMGKFIKVIPLVMITILLVSLVESLFVLPAHLSLGRRNGPPSGFFGRVERIRLRFGEALSGFVSGPYRRLLNLCVEYRYVTVAASIGILLIALGLVKGGVIKFRFMPEVDGDVITVDLQMPRGTLIEDTARVQEYLTGKAMEVVKEYDAERPEGDTVLRHIYSVVGGTLSRGGPVGGAGTSGTHLANLALLLTPSEKRGIPSAEIAARWRKLAGEVPGVDSLTFTSNLMRLGANIDVRFAHDRQDVLEETVGRFKQTLSQYPGVDEIADNHPLGKREVKIRLKPSARTLGITEEELGRQVRSAFYGAEALRLQRGRNEVKVMVRYPENDRRSLWDFRSMRIRTQDGNEIPILQGADVEIGRGFSVINRADRKRVINVTASVDSTVANAEEILDDLKNTSLVSLVNDYPGLSYDLEGEDKERRESLGSMQHGFMLALFAIFALLAIPFRSYSQPFLIMTAIPFGMVGAILGHLLMGFKLSMLSLFGIVAVSGVVVNDSLLLIDQINKNRLQDKNIRHAVLESGQRRFRPILLTSLTTFFGLMPMIFETSVQAQFLIPMAISLAFGILFATGITLILIPCLYMVLEDIRGVFGLKPLHENHRDSVPKDEGQECPEA